MLICAFIHIPNSYAEETGIVTKEDPQNVGARSEELERIAALESEIQNLTGRIEVLEHATKSVAPHPVESKTTEEATPNSDASLGNADDEKKDYDIALSTLKESKFEEAGNLFSAFIKKYPKSKSVSNAYFWYAESFYRQGDFDKAAIHYLKGYQQFPKSNKAADSLLKLALSLGELQKNKEACTILNKLDNEFKERSASSSKRSYDAKIKYGCK
jgi:tol-pal system protein YbgF